jgi:hypothetical protein
VCLPSIQRPKSTSLHRGLQKGNEGRSLSDLTR